MTIAGMVVVNRNILIPEKTYIPSLFFKYCIDKFGFYAIILSFFFQNLNLKFLNIFLQYSQLKTKTR